MSKQNNNNINSSNKSTDGSLKAVNSPKDEAEKDIVRVSEPTILGPKEPERRKKRKPILIIVLLIIIGIGAIAVYAIPAIMDSFNNTSENEDKDKDEDEDVEEVPENKNTTIVFDNVVTINGSGAAAEGNNITINAEGTYEVSGDTSNGSITVNAPSKEVNIILSGTNIKCTSDAAIKVLNAATVTLTLKNGTENYLEDGGSSEYPSTIFSDSNLIINGTGTLEIKGNVKNGLSAKNSDVTVNSGKIKITALEDGINAGGVITINSGTIYIDATIYGINSGKNILINNGEIYVIGGSSAITAGTNSEGIYQINGGTVIGLAKNITILPDEDSIIKTILFNLNQNIAEKDIFALTDSKGKEIISFEVNKDIKTISISTADIKDETYNLYSGVKHSGTTGYGIYPKGEITTGTKITIDNNSDFDLSATNNWFGSKNKS